MEVLSANSLTGLMERCIEYPNYKAGVLFNDCSRVKEFLSCIKGEIGDNECYGVSGISRAGIIKFKNGSYIRPITPDTKIRGLRINELIYDNLLELAKVEDIINTHIRTVIYHCDEQVTTVSESRSNSSLDDFLKEFKIL